MKETEPVSFILDKPLFKKYDISAWSFKEIVDVVCFDGIVDCFCPYCNQLSTFLGINENNPEIQRLRTDLNRARFGGDGGYESPDPRNQFIKPKTYQLDFRCSRSEDHILTVLHKVENKTIAKVGQSPSLVEIQKGDYKKYEKLLGKSYSDLYKAMMFYSFKFGVGAFTHLRRIIENFFLKEAYDIKRKDVNWDDVTYKKYRFKDKLNILKGLLPKSLVENPNVYSIISKGIHELEESECLLYFSAVKECIFLCLDDKLAEQNRIQREDLVKNELAKINSKINS